MEKPVSGPWACKLSGAALAVMVILAAAGSAFSASKFPKAWMDASSGYAIGGFDPVDYFVRKQASRPRAGVEVFWGGVNWRFRNTGNRGAFLNHPRTYVPRFGGADPYMLSKGRAVLGNPAIFEIHEDRVYLFYNELNLSGWRENRVQIAAKAAKAWPGLASKLGIDHAEVINPDDEKKVERISAD